MRAVIYDPPGHFEVREVADPTAGHGEVLIRVLQTGLCEFAALSSPGAILAR